MDFQAHCPSCGTLLRVSAEINIAAAVKTTFDEWVAWRKNQTRPTCDTIGCKELVRWHLRKQGFNFCDIHGGIARLEALYLETPTEVL